MKKDMFGREVVRDSVGRMQGFIDSTPNGSVARDQFGTRIGFTQNGSTYDNVGRRVLQNDQPGFFFGQKKKGL